MFPCVGRSLPFLLLSIGFYLHLSMSFRWRLDSLRQMILKVTILMVASSVKVVADHGSCRTRCYRRSLPLRGAGCFSLFQPTPNACHNAAAHSRFEAKGTVMDSTRPKLFSISLRLAAFALFVLWRRSGEDGPLTMCTLKLEHIFCREVTYATL